MWRSKSKELGLDANKRHNQRTVTSKKYEDPIFLEALESLRNTHSYIYVKVNTFDALRYAKPTDDKLEEIYFSLRLMSRQ